MINEKLRGIVEGGNFHNFETEKLSFFPSKSIIFKNSLVWYWNLQPSARKINVPPASQNSFITSKNWPNKNLSFEPSGT